MMWSLVWLSIYCIKQASNRRCHMKMCNSDILYALQFWRVKRFSSLILVKTMSVRQTFINGCKVLCLFQEHAYSNKLQFPLFGKKICFSTLTLFIFASRCITFIYHMKCWSSFCLFIRVAIFQKFIAGGSKCCL